ncbi:integrase catalytic domain-containing protein [Mesorhizobium tamadayense]|uniref:integrase catalytic domain-containing protein n=1 Tax=Mesorhizobium tamadayense TaxID=425306 RepID=UPI0026C832BF
MQRARSTSARSIIRPPTSISVMSGGISVGRAYLTIVTDVATRYIFGFCLTLETPSALSLALCLAQAMSPKEAWLTARDVEHRWPMFGRPRSLVTDSAKEFKGHAFQRGCEDCGIRIRYRGRGRVHQGGVAERLLGKLNSVYSPARRADPWLIVMNTLCNGELASASHIK